MRSSREVRGALERPHRQRCAAWLAAIIASAGFPLIGSACTTQDGRSAVYERCIGTSDCESRADACFTVAWDQGRGSVCSLDCAVPTDCPGPAGCYAIDGDATMRRICYARCRTDFDCARGFVCADAVIDGSVQDAICLPK